MQQRQFFKTESDFYRACTQSGTLQRIYYTSNTYDEEAREIKKDALVYLPYGYDTQEKYDVFYLMHGGGGNSDEVFGGLEAKTDLKNILDHMIEKKIIRPLIVVAPSFYYEGRTDALTERKAAGLLTQNFHQELIRDLLPAIEAEFSVKQGREHRAFGGYSMGSEATWNVFAKCLDSFQYFLPMSGDCWAVKIQGGLLCPQETVDYLENAVKKAGKAKEEYQLLVCVGDDGVAYKAVDTMVHEMRKRKEYFDFGESFESGNMIYCVAEGGTHSYEYCYQYIRCALPHFFTK
ncbi:MAG: hypothetical protein IJY09_06690 [Lachnospiraceae bacterium]|nr:hypothetical protein [Lachnospiraceae bacterium]